MIHDRSGRSTHTQARSIVLTSPTVATAGLSLTIPLAFLSDAVMGKLRGGAGEVLGALAVAGGFLLVSWRRKGDEMEGEGEAMVEGGEADKESEEGGGVSDGEWSVEQR